MTEMKKEDERTEAVDRPGAANAQSMITIPSNLVVLIFSVLGVLLLLGIGVVVVAVVVLIVMDGLGDAKDVAMLLTAFI